MYLKEPKSRLFNPEGNNYGGFHWRHSDVWDTDVSRAGGRGVLSRPYFVDKMFSDHLPQAGVQLLSVLVQYHGVSVSVQLLKTEPTVVLPLNLLNGVLQKVPDVVDILLIHRHLQKRDRLLTTATEASKLYTHA